MQRLDSGAACESLSTIAPIRLRHLPPLLRGRRSGRRESGTHASHGEEKREASVWNPSLSGKGEAGGVSLEPTLRTERKSARHQSGILRFAGEGEAGGVSLEPTLRTERKSARHQSGILRFSGEGEAGGVSLEPTLRTARKSARHQSGILPPPAGEGGGSRKGAIVWLRLTNCSKRYSR
jgi:preprotein translocase subunit Sec61beta